MKNRNREPYKEEKDRERERERERVQGLENDVRLWQRSTHRVPLLFKHKKCCQTYKPIQTNKKLNDFISEIKNIKISI